jgi:hypothetical protein
MEARTQPLSTVAPDRDAFLNHVPTDRRSHITNLVLHAVRRGAKTPSAVLAAVEAEIATCQERARYWNNTDSLARYDEVAAIFAAHRTEALAFCAWGLAWERLTPEQKARHRAAKGETYRRAYMEQQPATEAQLRYLAHLGHTGEVTSMAQASALIEQLRRAA